MRRDFEDEKWPLGGKSDPNDEWLFYSHAHSHSHTHMHMQMHRMEENWAEGGGKEETGKKEDENKKVGGKEKNWGFYLDWPMKWLKLREECEEIGRKLEMAQKVKEAGKRMMMGRGGEVGGEVKRLMDLKSNNFIKISLSN